MEYKNLIVTNQNNIKEIKLNRPESLNAFTLDLINEFLIELELTKKDGTKVLVISGEGRAFSAGGDLNAMKNKTGMFAGDEAELKKIYQDGIQQIPIKIEEIEIPIIAKVNGPAVGAGCDLACMCDLRIVSDIAFFKESFINLALVSGDGGAFFLHRLIGYGRTMEMLLTGRKVKAEEALSIGLVTQVVEHESLNEKVHELCEKLVNFPHEALKMNKAGIKNAYIVNLKDHLELMSSLQAKTQRSTEHFSLVDKFLSKK